MYAESFIGVRRSFVPLVGELVHETFPRQIAEPLSAFFARVRLSVCIVMPSIPQLKQKSGIADLFPFSVVPLGLLWAPHPVAGVVTPGY
jgi:hypothetical protein